jgi:hypothetical protein
MLIEKELKHLLNNKAGIFIVILGLTLNLMGLENVDRVTELRNKFFYNLNPFK